MHAVYGLDLLDFFRGRHPWGKLARLLGHLREGSAYWVATARDRDLARMLAEKNKGVKKPSPMPLTEMNTTNQLLVALVDGMGLLVQRIEQLGGAKARPHQLLPVERPAVAEAREWLKQRELDALVAEAEAAQRLVRKR